MKILLLLLIFLVSFSCSTYKMKQTYKEEYMICNHILNICSINHLTNDTTIFLDNTFDEFYEFNKDSIMKELSNSNYKLINIKQFYSNLGNNFYLNSKGINSSNLFYNLLTFKYQVCINKDTCNVFEFIFVKHYNKYKLSSLNMNPDLNSKFIKPKINTSKIFDYP